MLVSSATILLFCQVEIMWHHRENRQSYRLCFGRSLTHSNVSPYNIILSPTPTFIHSQNILVPYLLRLSRSDFHVLCCSLEAVVINGQSTNPTTAHFKIKQGSTRKQNDHHYWNEEQKTCIALCFEIHWGILRLLKRWLYSSLADLTFLASVRINLHHMHSSREPVSVSLKLSSACFITDPLQMTFLILQHDGHI